MLLRFGHLIALLVCGILFNSCERDEDQYTIGNPGGPLLADIIGFQSISTPALADSFTPVLIKLKIDPQAAGNKKDIRLVTSLGSFSNNDTAITVGANSAGEVTVPLKSAKAGLASLRATINNVRIDTFFTFAPAPPQDMILSSDKYLLDTLQNTTAVISARLFRDQGTVSDPIKVNFTVTPDVPAAANLLIDPFVFSENREAKANLTNPYLSKGWFTVSAYTLVQSGDTLRKSLRIKVE